LLLWWIMKVSNQICKSESDLSRMNYESKTGWKSGQWYFLTKIVLTYCEKNCSSDREKLNAENLQKLVRHCFSDQPLFSNQKKNLSLQNHFSRIRFLQPDFSTQISQTRFLKTAKIEDAE
jgi:hypothetical protein